jgi:excisionase family DNA binding protein
MMIGQVTNHLLNIREVSELLHLHPNTVRRWCDQGKLPCLRISARGDRRIRQEDLQSYLDKMNGSPRKSGRRRPQKIKSKVKRGAGSIGRR